MNKKCSSRSDNIITRSVSTNSSRNNTSCKQPVTVSEKVLNLEQKFVVLAEDIGQLKIDLESSKLQLSEAKNEIAKLNRESTEDIRKNTAEVCENVENKVDIVLAQLKIDLQSTKDQLLESKNEIARVERVNAEEIRQNRVEIQYLKTKLELVDANVPVKIPEQVKVVKADATLPRKTFQKLPCKNESELEALKEDLMRDLDTCIYMEERFGAIGGSDPKSCITSILNRLFSNEFQSLMSLTGKRTEKPIVLMDYMAIMDVINNSVRITHATHKDKDSEAIITKILSNK